MLLLPIRTAGLMWLPRAPPLGELARQRLRGLERNIMLQIEHLTKKYGEKKAVDDLSLHICPGEIYGFIGHNGAGKTTTIKSCCGILQFEEGDIRINGISVKDDPIACKKKKKRAFLMI